mgnify:CR=1 FL=1
MRCRVLDLVLHLVLRRVLGLMLGQSLVRTEVCQVGRWEERWLQATDLGRVQEERARQVQATDQEERVRQVQATDQEERARQRVVVQMEKARALAVDPLVAKGKGRLRSRERIRLQCCLRA